MDIYVNNTLVTTQSDSVYVTDKIDERSTAGFIVIDLTNQYDFKKGMPIQIDNDLSWVNAEMTWDEAEQTWDDGELLFSGWIDKPIKYSPYGDGVFYHRITCMDNHYLADKRIISRAYQDEAVEDIVQDIFTDFLSGEGITVGQIDTGVTIKEAIFNYITVSDALNALADKVGYYWQISHDRKLYFRQRGRLMLLLMLAVVE